MFLKKRIDFSKTNIIKGFFTALFFSSFIYLEYFGVELKLLNTIFALISICFILVIPRTALFIAGFFIGIFWFYWISFSFVYYDLSYLIPFIIVGFGLIYGAVFFIIGFFENVFYRGFALFLLSFISILGFNWLQIELLLLNSYFGVFKYQLFIVIFSTVLAVKFRWYFLILLIFALNYENNPTKIEDPNIKIYTPQFNIPQEIRWEKAFLNDILEENFKQINYAIENNYDLIILPETAFPLVLNRSKEILNILKENSKQIDIITGSISKQENSYFNSTFHFSNGNYFIANKVVLVPFGEEIPLPKFLQDFINDIFYDGASDYAKAKEPTNFVIKGVKFRNAICYETTTNEIFKNLDGAKYIISISNNAWFTPSIEPTLQKLLMSYYSKIYGVNIYAVLNGSPNFIIRN